MLRVGCSARWESCSRFAGTQAAGLQGRDHSPAATQTTSGVTAPSMAMAAPVM